MTKVVVVIRQLQSPNWLGHATLPSFVSNEMRQKPSLGLPTLMAHQAQQQVQNLFEPVVSVVIEVGAESDIADEDIESHLEQKAKSHIAKLQEQFIEFRSAKFWYQIKEIDK